MKVWVTRDEECDGPLSSALEAAGLEVIHEPVLRRRVVTDTTDVIASLGFNDWLVLTSVYATEVVKCEMPGIPNTAVVSDASRRAALARGFRVELVSPDGTGRSLFHQLGAIVKSGIVCYPRSSMASPPQAWSDVELISPVLYETAPRPFDSAVVDRADVVCVASPSAVEAVGPVDLRFASIGSTTSAAIRRLGLEPWVEAPQRSFDSLADAIASGIR